MIDFRREYRDTQEMIDKIDIFLSKNKEDYKALDCCGKQLVFKDYTNKLKTYNYDDILEINVYENKIELGIYTELLEKHNKMLKVYISKTKDKYIYEFIEKKIMKVWKQMEFVDFIQAGGNNGNNNKK